MSNPKDALPAEVFVALTTDGKLEASRTNVGIVHDHVVEVRRFVQDGGEVVRLRKALREIAAFHDVSASEHLAETGSYSSFDEPASVEIARAALKGVKP